MVSEATRLSRALNNGTAQTKVRRGPKVSMSQFHQLVMAACGHRCEIRSPVCTGRASQAHHVLLRKHGGENTRENGLGACDACHLFLHHNPAIAYQAGWLRRRHPKPGDYHYEGE